MKHKHHNRILGRTNNHRKALLRSLVSSLLRHGFITTTEAKGKELRQYFEPLITTAKRELTLNTRRQLLKDLLHATDLPALLEVAKDNQSRPGGYLRLTHVPTNRHDSAAMVRVDILRPAPPK